jgi:quercetin 2,3-dioxygenase
MSLRAMRQIDSARPTLEGAGVHLRRGFGFGKSAAFDPFLLFDDFSSNNPSDYQPGFPWHPHRGIETITYVLAGSVEHKDSLGNQGTLGAGDLQWMTAGSGILHQEMPKGDALGHMHGFQLWANLPSSLKMTAPRYQDIPASAIPEVTEDDGTTARILCGEFWGKRGPAEGVAASPRYLDITIPAGKLRHIPVELGHSAFAYVFAGAGFFRDASTRQAVMTASGADPAAAPVYDARRHSLVLFDSGDEIVVQAGAEGIRFLLASGHPFGEPVAWQGPIVMNTRAELRQAFHDMQQGTFIRHK